MRLLRCGLDMASPGTLVQWLGVAGQGTPWGRQSDVTGAERAKQADYIASVLNSSRSEASKVEELRRIGDPSRDK